MLLSWTPEAFLTVVRDARGARRAEARGEATRAAREATPTAEVLLHAGVALAAAGGLASPPSRATRAARGQEPPVTCPAVPRHLPAVAAGAGVVVAAAVVVEASDAADRVVAAI